MRWVVLRGSCSRGATASATSKCRMARSGRVAVILDPSLPTGGTGMPDLTQISPPQMTCQDPAQPKGPPGRHGKLGLPRPITGQRHCLSVYSWWSLPLARVLWQRAAPVEALVGAQGLKSFCPFKTLIGGPLMGLLDGSFHTASLRRPFPALSRHDRGGNGPTLKLAVVSGRRPD